MFGVKLEHVGFMAWDEEQVLAAGSNTLDLFQFSQEGFTPLQSVGVRSALTCLEWSSTSEPLLAAGSDSGSVSFWRKRDLRQDGGASVIKEDKIQAFISALQFCPSKQSLLALGGQEVFIYNVEAGLKQRDPTQYVFKLGSNQSVSGSLTALSWNPQVQYILAAASQSGLATVWDLRNNKTLFNVHDPHYHNKSVCSSLTWNPEIPTQFIMSYDDTNPTLQIWDLRKHEYPVKEFGSFHTAGITSTAWCPFDYSLLASADRSGSVVVWNFKNGERLNSVSSSLSEPVNAVKWVPGKYGLMALGSEDGSVEVRSIYDVGVPDASTPVKVRSEESAPRSSEPTSAQAPKWLLKRAGVAFGFGNKVASFSNGQSVSLSQLQRTDGDFEEECRKVHSLVTAKRWGDVCANFTHKLPDGEHLQWQIIKSKQENNPLGVLEALGFSKQAVQAETEKYTGKKRSEKPETQTRNIQDTFSFAEMNPEDAVDFFNKLGTPEPVQTAPSASPEVFTNTITETVSKNVDWNTGGEKLIKENLILRNLDSAIDCALMCGRTAEALIIAEHGGPELFMRTKHTIFQNSLDPFVQKTFEPLLGRNIGELIAYSDTDRWQQTLAIIVMHAGDQVKELTIELANKLDGVGEYPLAVQVCLIVAEEVERLLELWAEANSNPQYMFCKALALCQATGFNRESEILERISFNYIKYLERNFCEFSLLTEVLGFLKPPRFNMDMMTLNERFTKLTTGRSSKVPWTVVNVVPVKRASGLSGVKFNSSGPNFFDNAPKQAFPEPPSSSAVSGSQHVPPPPLRTAFGGEKSLSNPPPPSGPFGSSVAPTPVNTPLGPPVTTAPPPPPPPKGGQFADTAPKSAFNNPFPNAETGVTPPPPVAKQPIQPPPANKSFPPTTAAFPTPKAPPPVPPTAQPPLTQPPQTNNSAFNAPGGQTSTANFAKPPGHDAVVAETPPKTNNVPPPPPSHSVPRPPPPPRPNRGTEPTGPTLIRVEEVPADVAPVLRVWSTALEAPAIQSSVKIKKDLEGKMNDLFIKLKDNRFDAQSKNFVMAMSSAVGGKDWPAAMEAYNALAAGNWAENSSWLMAAKRIIQLNQR